MRDKKYIQSDIENAKSAIEDLPKKRLGFLLYSLSILGCGEKITIGRFNFYHDKHDTGVNVRVYIENEGETFDVINGTYWYNHGQYGHNKFTHNRGAWDSAFEEAILTLKDKAKQLYLKKIARLEREIESVRKAESDKKKRFEALF